MPKKGTSTKLPSKKTGGVAKAAKINDTRQTRSRVRSKTDDLQIAMATVNKATKQGGNESQNKAKKRISEPIVGHRGSKVVRRIDFDSDKGISHQITTNNNAQPEHSKFVKDTAKSNPDVFDENHNFGDGVQVDIDPREEHEFGDSEYESDDGEPINYHDDGTLNSQGNNVPVQQVSIPDSKDGEFNPEEYQAILKDKTLMRVFDHLLKEKVEIAKKEIMASASSTIAAGMAKGRNSEKNQSPNLIVNKANNQVSKKPPNVKSPSDTTLYAPAVKKVGQASNAVDQLNVDVQQDVHRMREFEMFNKISNFVDSIRISDKDRAEAGGSQTSQVNPVEDDQEQIYGNKGFEERDAYLRAKEKAEQAIIEAEKYKAVLADPPGEKTKLSDIMTKHQTDKGVLENIPDIGTGLSDDDFFHLTCQVDPNLISKIEKGEFVDLDKLLPKDRKRRSTDENRMEWIHSEGGTFLAPVTDRSAKITGFRRWEQAFRIYSTIYCEANPQRSKEMWQYITVINTASSAYVWDNVYDYDITFRHLMAFNPNRSWAVTYNQMWNLCMREPLVSKPFTFQQRSGGGYNPKGNTGHKKKGKPDYCWFFNRGEKCRYGKKCRFVEKCSYCDSPSHGVNTCYKKEKDETGTGSGGPQIPKH